MVSVQGARDHRDLGAALTFDKHDFEWLQEWCSGGLLGAERGWVHGT